MLRNTNIIRYGVVIPAYNEEIGIQQCVDQVFKEINSYINSDNISVIVVDDGSSDKTWEILSELKNVYKNGLTIYKNPSNTGYGGALIKGLELAASNKCDYVVYIDSDLTNNPKYLKNFIDICNGKVDCVKASRYISGGGASGVPMYRVAISKIGNQIAKYLFGTHIHDCTNGYRMIKTELALRIPYKEKGFGIILEEMYYLVKMNAKIEEFPNILTSRKSTKSHFVYDFKTIWSYLKYPLRIYFMRNEAKLSKFIKFLSNGFRKPDFARKVYDIFAICLVSLVLVFRSGGDYFKFALIFILSPIIFLISAEYLGIYSRYKTASIYAKAVLLSLTAFSVSAFLVIVARDNLSNGVIIKIFVLDLVLTLLPRFFFNYYTDRNFNFIKNVNNDKLPLLVVGGAGYIGSYVVKNLLERGKNVRVIDKFIFGTESLTEIKKEYGNRLDVVSGDITDVSTLSKSMQNVSGVVHLAGLVGDPACAVDEKLTRHVNIISTKLIKDIVRGYGIERLVFASSCSVYGYSLTKVNENSELNPVSMYAKTKIDSERELLNEQSDYFHPTILRFATVFGHSRRMRFDLVANLFTAHAHEFGKITVMGSDQWRPFIHASDVANAVSMVATAPLNLVSRQIFNVGDDSLNITIGKLAQNVKTTVEKIDNNKMVNIEIKDDIVDKRNYLVSFDKISKVLGFKANINFSSGIEEMYKNILSGGYKYKFNNTIYSNYLMTEHLVSEFRSADYRNSHFSLLD